MDVHDKDEMLALIHALQIQSGKKELLSIAPDVKGLFDECKHHIEELMKMKPLEYVVDVSSKKGKRSAHSLRDHKFNKQSNKQFHRRRNK